MARSPKTIGLPLPESLESNNVEAIKLHFKLYKEALDNMYKLLLSDITTIVIGDGSAITIGDWIYFGDQTTDGTWRIGKATTGTSWVMQRREAGTYVSKGGATA